MNGKVHKYRIDHEGGCYEWIARGSYKRVECPPGVTPKPLLSFEIMLARPDDLFIKTHRAVLKVGCEFCHATRGQPCRGRHGSVNSSTHWSRRESWQTMKRLHRSMQGVFSSNDGHSSQW